MTVSVILLILIIVLLQFSEYLLVLVLHFYTFYRLKKSFQKIAVILVWDFFSSPKILRILVSTSSINKMINVSVSVQ